MQLVDFDPENELEHAIFAAKQGQHTLDDLIGKLAESNLYISSKTEVQQDGSGFDPLLLRAPDGSALVAAFSSLSRSGLHRNVAEYVLQMKGREFFLRTPASYGVIVNPGYVSQLIITPGALAGVKRNLAAQRRQVRQEPRWPRPACHLFGASGSAHPETP